MEYTRNRKVFGKTVASFQNTRFKLAEMKAELAIGRVYIDRCIELVLNKKLGVDDAATAKYWASDLMGKVIDECLQLHGGYGYMLEYPIARAWIDARAQAHLRRHQRDHEGVDRAHDVSALHST